MIFSHQLRYYRFTNPERVLNKSFNSKNLVNQLFNNYISNFRSFYHHFSSLINQMRNYQGWTALVKTERERPPPERGGAF